MLTKVGHGISKRRFVVACRCALNNNKNEVKIILEEDFIKQPFLKLYAKLKGNTHGIKTPHADKSGTRDFEKEILCCVPMCIKKEEIIKSKSC